MTTCSQCGQPLLPGATTCPRCGLSLMPPPPGPGMHVPPADQSMPAWLRSFQGTQQASAPARPQEPMPGNVPPTQPPPSAHPEGSLSVNSLVSEEALPDWVRNADDRRLAGGAPTGQQPWGAGAQTPGSGWGATGFGAPAGQPGQPAPPFAPMTGAQPMTPASGWAQSAGVPQAPGQWPPQAAGPVPPSAYAPSGHGMGEGRLPATGGGMPPSSQLFDESALPSWLSAAGAAPQPPAGAAPWGYNAGASSASPFNIAGGMYGVPSAAASAAPAGSGTGELPGQSLLDTSALPQWLGGRAGEREPAAPEQALGGDGMRAQALVDERSLPLWLRQEPSMSAEAPAPGAVSQWLASPATDEPLPSWLNQVYAAAQVPRVPVSDPVAAPWETPAAGAAPTLGTMAGSQLLDDAALPDWLQAAGAPGGPSNFPGAPDPAYAQPYPAAHSGPFQGPVGGASGAGVGIPASNQPFAFGGAVPLVSPSEMSDSLDWSGGAPAGPAQFAPSASLASPAVPESSASAGGERFSASDLIDPDVLPAWVHQQGPAAEPVFSSTQGWTNKQASANPGYGYFEPAASSQMATAGGWGEPRGTAAAAPLDEANLPPWLRGPEAPAGYTPNGGDEMHQSGRWGRAGVPDGQLPPWLRGGDGRPNGRPYQAGAGGEQQSWGGDASSAGWGAAAGDYPAQPPSPAYPGEWGGQAAAGTQPMTHYADRFQDEIPGAQRPFGYAYDHDAMPGDYQPGPPGGAGQPSWNDQPRSGGRRRRWFGRK